jgi:ppGpp synthetase/RelA/SpoT-type nucleotidyltranferase
MTPNDTDLKLQSLLPSEIADPDDFDAWFEPIRKDVQVAVSEVSEAASSALDVKRDILRVEEGCNRPVWTLTDAAGFLKTTTSVRSKLARELAEENVHDPLTLHEVEQRVVDFPDLGRFRIVCDFASDIQCALGILLDSGRRVMLSQYSLRGKVKNYVLDLRLRRPDRGHRAYQFVVRVPGCRQCFVEIQLMSLLQAAWDTRNHPMYEWSREGHRLPERLVISDVALAETLYLVDEQAKRNWRSFLRARRSNA